VTSPASPSPDDPLQPDPLQPDPLLPKPLPGAVAFVSMGTSLAGCIAVGLFLGIWLDHLAGTSPLFLIIGLVAGVSAAVFSVVAQVRRFL
jgi:hypothetical protein